MKNLKFLLLFMATIVVLSACNNQQEKADSKEKTVETPKETIIDKDATDKSDTVTRDVDIQKEIEKEKGVSQVSLIITEDGGGFVILDFEVDDKMKKPEAKQLAEKYANKLKEKYKEHNIDVQARKSGDTFAQVTK